jgi:hypothetical protein
VHVNKDFLVYTGGTLIKRIDTIIAFFNDEHSGSHVSPLPSKQWEFRGRNVTPNLLQRTLYDFHQEVSSKIGKKRKDKRLIVVKLGDMIDGIHHETKELITQYLDEQRQINQELTERSLHSMNFGGDDLLYWVAGTPAHAGEDEETLAHDFDATVPYSEARTVWPVLRININGIYCMFFHHGATNGKGANKGNALRNRLKALRYDCMDNGEAVPRLVVTADKHQMGYEDITNNGKIVMRGVISPAWQVKTDFVYKISAEALSKVGAVTVEITQSGEVKEPEFMTLKVEQDRVEVV